MGYLRKNKVPTVTKSPKAQQFQNGLLDEIRFDSEISPLWIKYRFDIVLPINDDEKVIFTGRDNNYEFEKLKDFISDFEKHWVFVL